MTCASGAAAFPLVGCRRRARRAPCRSCSPARPNRSWRACWRSPPWRVLTGALHLDGLADTADALARAGSDPGRAARKDPAVGPGGVVGARSSCCHRGRRARRPRLVGRWLVAGAALVVAATRRAGRCRSSPSARPASRPAEGSAAGSRAASGRPMASWRWSSPASSPPSWRSPTRSVAVALGGAGRGGRRARHRRRRSSRCRRSSTATGSGAIVELTVAAALTVAALARERAKGRARGWAAHPGPRRDAQRQEPFGLAAATRLAGDDGRVWFLATAWPGDPELDDRIARHRAARPPSWPTVEVGPDLAAALARTDPDEPVLIDGLTLWLSTLLGDERRPSTRSSTGRSPPVWRRSRPARAGRSWSATRSARGSCRCTPGARAYRDLVGIAHQRLADAGRRGLPPRGRAAGHAQGRARP